MDWKKAKRKGNIEDRRLGNAVISQKLAGISPYNDSTISSEVKFQRYGPPPIDLKVSRNTRYKKEIPYDDE
jgi:hypothetical protein